MKWNEQVRQIADEAEKKVRELIGRAIADGSYDEVERMMGVVRQFADIGQGFSSVTVKGKAALAIPSRGGKMQSGRKHRLVKRRTRGKQPTRFYRDGKELVKEGPSSGGSGRYRHRAPKHLLDTLIEQIRKIADSDSMFVIEDILKADGVEGTPTYLVYVCMAWLVSTGLVQRHGRQGYSVASAADLQNAVEQKWALLARK